MFEALVITIREGVEAALVLAIALAFLRRRGLEKRIGALAAGAACAVVVSAAATVWASRVTYNEELAEGIAMLVGSILVITLVWWMWKAAPGMKSEIERGMERATLGAGSVGVFLFAFGVVFREGAETAVFLSAAGFTSKGLGLWLGALIGLLIAIAFGVLFVRGSLRVPLKPFFSITTAVLSLVALQLFVGGLHELSEAQVLPSSRQEMAIIGPFIKNELLLFTLTVALAAGWLLFGRAGAEPKASAASGPAARLERATRRRDVARRRWTGVVALLVVGLLTTAFVQRSRTPDRPPALTLPLLAGVARFDPAPLADGHLHFYQVDLPERPIRFFAVRVGEQVRACFDACEICGDKGYYEDGASVVCRNCTSPIVRTSLGRTGGCNPIPLPTHAIAGPAPRLEVREGDLRAVIPRLEGR